MAAKTITAAQARKRDWPTPRVGDRCEFYCEVFEESAPAGERLRNYTGQTVVVITEPDRPEDDSTLYRVRADDGREFSANLEELNGWDKALGQYVGPSGEWGEKG